jgi:hypothetical protein
MDDFFKKWLSVEQREQKGKRGVPCGTRLTAGETIGCFFGTPCQHWSPIVVIRQADRDIGTHLVVIPLAPGCNFCNSMSK